MKRKIYLAQYDDAIATRMAEIVGPFGVHAATYRGYSITHLDSGLGVFNIFDHRKDAIEMAERLATIKEFSGRATFAKMQRAHIKINKLISRDDLLRLTGKSSVRHITRQRYDDAMRHALIGGQPREARDGGR